MARVVARPTLFMFILLWWRNAAQSPACASEIAEKPAALLQVINLANNITNNATDETSSQTTIHNISYGLSDPIPEVLPMENITSNLSDFIPELPPTEHTDTDSIPESPPTEHIDNSSQTRHETRFQMSFDNTTYNFANPNPDLLKWDDVTTYPTGVTFMYGSLKVPLEHNEMDNIYDDKYICLPVRGVMLKGVKKMSKSKPLLFTHCGGPGSDVECHLGMQMDILEQFNIVTISQRGVGTPRECPFKSNGRRIKQFPLIRCNELNKNLPQVWSQLGIKPSSPEFPMAQAIATNGLTAALFGTSDLKYNESAVRWLYRLTKLEYEMCYRSPQWQFNSSSQRKHSSALEFMGTQTLAYDIDTLREALGSGRLSCWGASYGTQVCGTYATIFPQKVFRLILDGNVDPRPDVLTQANEASMGAMAVFRGITAACEASSTADDASDVCPLAPFMAEKVRKAMTTNAAKEMMINQFFSAWGAQADVPCSAFMVACMAKAVEGTPGKFKGCPTKICDMIDQALGLNTTSATDAPVGPNAPTALIAQPPILLFKHAAEVDGIQQDKFGAIPVIAVNAVDVHGRLTEEGLVNWWQGAKKEAIFGLDRALLYAIGISVWPVLPRPVPPIGDATLRPLIIGNLRDLQTSYISSQEMKMSFPQGRLMTYQGYGHCLSPLPGASLNAAAMRACHDRIAQYLLRGTMPNDGTVCAVAASARVGAPEESKLESCMSVFG